MSMAEPQPEKEPQPARAPQPVTAPATSPGTYSRVVQTAQAPMAKPAPVIQVIDAVELLNVSSAPFERQAIAKAERQAGTRFATQHSSAEPTRPSRGA